MGYCTATRNGKEVYVCDKCENANESVKKRSCPFGYCSPSYLCSACNAKLRSSRTAVHKAKGCESRHEEYEARRRNEASLLAAGLAVRCSAIGVGEGPDYRVHVLFRKADGSCIGFYMGKATYDAIGLLTTATPDDYRTHGILLDAPSDFSHA